jgi:putative ABC transport system permease protein
MMFDATKFGVAVVTQEALDSFGTGNLHYCYSWKYDTPVDEDEDATDESRSNGVLKALYLDDDVDMDSIVSYTPEYSNQAIHFAGDDMGGDRAMMVALLYVVIVIIAFVFAITTSNTIYEESHIIGTLRASGYSKSEILTHYITAPTIVTVVSAIVGNVVGYTAMKDFCVEIYYASYSLPTYETVWSLEAFILTTVVPSY